MKHKTFFQRIISVTVCSLMVLQAPAFYVGADNINTDNENDADEYAVSQSAQDKCKEIIDEYYLDENVVPYKEYIKTVPQNKPADTVTIEGDSFSSYQENGVDVTPEILSDYMGVEGNSVLTSETGYIEYEFDVKEAGLYEMSFDYFPYSGKNTDIQRSILIDGNLPFVEASLIEFYRVWTSEVSDFTVDDNGFTVKSWGSDNQGNDLKPSSVEVPQWITTSAKDSDGYITDNFSFYLGKGKHTLSLLSSKEAMLINKIELKASESIVSYDEKLKEWDALGATDTSGVNIVVEGESCSRTSSQMIYPLQDKSSPTVYPSDAKLLKNNSVGGESWKLAGQWIEWQVDVPQTGYYNISMYTKQNFVRGVYVSRQIKIDDEVQFDEMSDYKFGYKGNWRKDTLQNDDGNFKFYLTEGTHTISMEVVLGDLAEIISEVQTDVQQLNEIYRKIIRITGVAPDKYRDYQIERKLPELTAELKEVEDNLTETLTKLRAITGKSSDKETALKTMRDQLQMLGNDNEKFTRYISDYKINVRALGNWITTAMAQPLQIDRLYIHSPDVTPKSQNDNIFAKLFFELKRLFWSFIIDYNKIGNVEKSSAMEDKTITLWIGSGRDQANIIKSLIDKNFTNEYGINVNVQLVDMNTLLRATLVGEGPDVAIQVANTNGLAGSVLVTGNDTPVNYGLRNAVVDLSQFDDFDEVSERFAPSAFTAFQFDGATYALPETQTFPMMFYRKDILAELGLEIPQTWNDVKVIMSVLSKNQMEFGMLPDEQIFASLLYQNGGQYYTDDATRSALDSDTAISVFKEYCEFYTDYRLDKLTSVEERFRTGETPIIIADYTVYNNFQISAPDIKGLWDFAPVPGTVQEDGSIDRSTSCTGLASIIMEQTEHKDECWEFLKWWTSAETQTLYGREMETLMGSAARVPTANIEALQSLPWPEKQSSALMEQFQYVKGIPQVPGGYYTWRNVNNAFYTITTDESADENMVSPREELMEKVISINAEIDFKRKEFGLPLSDDAKDGE